MKIYTGNGADTESIQVRGMGVMIPSTPDTVIRKEYKSMYCALDNGAFGCYSKGYPFQADVFRDTMRKAFKNNLSLDFIVCPDIVCGGVQSLKFSMSWAKGELLGTPNLALVVQDGMQPSHLDNYILAYFTYIFIGGSVEWKWETAEQWVNFAHKNNKKCHIGQCGKLGYLERARELGADSVDSTSWVVNNSFHIIDEFQSNQPNLFEAESCV
jgi:hypothetical protein